MILFRFLPLSRHFGKHHIRNESCPAIMSLCILPIKAEKITELIPRSPGGWTCLFILIAINHNIRFSDKSQIVILSAKAPCVGQLQLQGKSDAGLSIFIPLIYPWVVALSVSCSDIKQNLEAFIGWDKIKLSHWILQVTSFSKEQWLKTDSLSASGNVSAMVLCFVTVGSIWSGVERVVALDQMNEMSLGRINRLFH